MTSITFDTHFFVKALEKKGFTETQAEGVVDMVKKVHAEATETLATKSDLMLLESRMIIKLGAMQFAMLVALGGFIKLFVH